MKTATFSIDGMHCEGCAETIEALLRMEPGVQASTVSFEDRSARVLYDPARTSEGRLVAAIACGGYTAARQAS
jgi:copper chaperone CopZ